MAYKWVPVWGRFDVDGSTLTFRGGEEPAILQPDSDPPSPNEPPRMVAHVGIALSDQLMADGTVEADVTFSGVTSKTACNLVFGHNPATGANMAAGLGGVGNPLFAIRQWFPAPRGASGETSSKSGWVTLEQGGQKDNLRAGIPYHLKVRVQGSEVSLLIDGVEVATTTVPASSSEPRHVGVFCLNEHDITIANFRAKAQRSKAFVVMQFSSPYNELYSHVIKDVCGPLEIDPIRADEIYGGASIIIKDVIDRIAESRVVIADISPDNPNVYFEVGYALALRKPIILLAQKRRPDQPLPFDLSAFRVLFYDDSIGGKPKLEEGLREHLSQILGKT